MLIIPINLYYDHFLYFIILAKHCIISFFVGALPQNYPANYGCRILTKSPIFILYSQTKPTLISKALSAAPKYLRRASWHFIIFRF